MTDTLINEEKEESIKIFYQILSDKNSTDNQRVEAFINLSNHYVYSDFSESFKYATLATIVTNIPRADACCCIADKYLMLGEYKWAEIWYKHAMNNSLTKECDSKYWGYIPLRNIAQIKYSNGEKEHALNIIEALLITRPDDEELIELKKIFLEN